MRVEAGVVVLLLVLSWRRGPVLSRYRHAAMLVGRGGSRRRSRQSHVRGGGRGRLGRWRRRWVERHGGVLYVVVLALEQVRVGDGMRAAARARRTGSTSRRQQRVLRSTAQRRKERVRRRRERAEVGAIGREGRRGVATGCAI